MNYANPPESFRVTSDQLEDIDQFAREHGLSRDAAVGLIIEIAHGRPRPTIITHSDNFVDNLEDLKANARSWHADLEKITPRLTSGWPTSRDPALVEIVRQNRELAAKLLPQLAPFCRTISSAARYRLDDFDPTTEIRVARESYKQWTEHYGALYLKYRQAIQNSPSEAPANNERRVAEENIVRLRKYFPLWHLLYESGMTTILPPESTTGSDPVAYSSWKDHRAVWDKLILKCKENRSWLRAKGRTERFSARLSKVEKSKLKMIASKFGLRKKADAFRVAFEIFKSSPPASIITSGVASPEELEKIKALAEGMISRLEYICSRLKAPLGLFPEPELVQQVKLWKIDSEYCYNEMVAVAMAARLSRNVILQMKKADIASVKNSAIYWRNILKRKCDTIRQERQAGHSKSHIRQPREIWRFLFRIGLVDDDAPSFDYVYRPD